MSTRTAPQQQRDAQGRRLCRLPGCGKLVAPGRRSWCSNRCRDEFSVRYYGPFTRAAVLARDGGVCALCGRDTLKIQRVLLHLERMAGWTYAMAVGRLLGFDRYDHPGDVWQADHIRPVVRGGMGDPVHMLRCLCTRCHKRVTADLARELAAERKAAANANGDGDGEGRLAAEPQAGLAEPEHADDGPEAVAAVLRVGAGMDGPPGPVGHATHMAAGRVDPPVGPLLVRPARACQLAPQAQVQPADGRPASGPANLRDVRGPGDRIGAAGIAPDRRADGALFAPAVTGGDVAATPEPTHDGRSQAAAYHKEGVRPC